MIVLVYIYISTQEKSRLASCLTSCDLKNIKLNKSSPAHKEVIAALVEVLKHANDWCANVIVDAIQSLDGSDELIEHLVASVQAAPSAAEISRISRCMAHCNVKQFDWKSDLKSFRKRGIEDICIYIHIYQVDVAGFSTFQDDGWLKLMHACRFARDMLPCGRQYQRRCDRVLAAFTKRILLRHAQQEMTKCNSRCTQIKLPCPHCNLENALCSAQTVTLNPKP